MRFQAGKKLLSIILTLTLILGLMPPVSGAASEGDGTTSSLQVITSFADLAYDVAAQNVAYGTAESELNLPATLHATVDSTPTDIDATWVSADYDGEAAGEYVFTAKISDEYQLEDGLTLPVIIVTVQAAEEETQEQTVSTMEETETTVPETAEPEAQAQSVTITIEEQDGSASLYFKANEAIKEAALLAGVSAVDEQGEAVEVTLEDLGGLNLSSPQYQTTPYTLTYAAIHPESGEKFTVMREIYVIGMSLRASEPDYYIFDISEGNITIEPGVSSGTLMVTYGSAQPQSTTNDFPNTQQITIIGTSTANNKVLVKDGAAANITLKGVTISNADESPFQLIGSSVVELTLDGANMLECTTQASSGLSEGRYAGLYVAPDAKITIKAGTDNASLTANGGDNGAGIGGSFISSISSADNAAGTITINSGEVTANGGYAGAGIGGGYSGAVIVGGYEGAGGNIEISGGEVTANGGYAGAGIGGGFSGAGGNIEISGGEVSANGGNSGAGIGGGPMGDGGTITIEGGIVEANGSVFGAGIGGGFSGAGGTIAISGGTITATKGSDADNDIGYGEGRTAPGANDSIKITGGSVNPTNGEVSPQPTDSSGSDIYLNILTVGSSANANITITAGSVGSVLMEDNPAPQNGYGINDVTTDSYGKVYFWLPQTDNGGTDNETVSAVADNRLYTATYERNSSPVIETLELVTIADGNILITQFNDYYTVEIGSFSLRYDYAEAFTITGTSTMSLVKVSSDSGFSGSDAVKIVLKGATISSANQSPLQLLGTSVVELTLSGTNTLTCTCSTGSNGIFAGLYVAPNAKITIAAETDDASLTASGGFKGAGIGGSSITPSDKSANAAGVINIDSGSVTATGGGYGAGIGGGYYGACGTVEISGGSVTATGGDSGGGQSNGGAGIGSGQNGADGSISISGGTIQAKRGGKVNGNDIGGGSGGSVDSVTITGGSLCLTNGIVSPQPTNGNADVYLNTLTLGSPSINNDTALLSAAIDGDSDYYGINDVVTMNDGIIYFWLPQNSSTSGSVAITADSSSSSGDTYAAAWVRTGTSETKTLLKSPYAVTFESNGGSTVNTQYINFFDKVIEPIAPTRDGYTFDGWYTDDSAFANAWIFDNDTVTEPITLYAKWKDTTSPTGVIQVRNNSWVGVLNPITFKLFYKGTVEVKIIGADSGSGVDTIDYIIAEDEMSLEELKNASWMQYNDTFSINMNCKFIIYVRITDKEGNSTIINSDGVVRYTDSQQDTANISSIKTGTDDIRAKVTLNGNTVAGISNGTNTLNVDSDYSVDNSNGEITFKADYLNSLAAGMYTLVISYQPLGITYIEESENDAPATTTITLDVVKASQIISNVYDMTKTYGDLEFGINPIVFGNPEITFKSSDTDVASITQNGTITILGAGETTITIQAATTDDYKSAETSFKLTVNQAEQSISNLTPVEKTYGDANFTLEPAGYEEPVFTYTSSHEDVAEVDENSGEVKIVGAGTAEITVTAEATRNYAGTSAKCEVTVHKAEQTISNLAPIEKTYGDANFTLEPAGYEEPVFTYTSSHEDVAEVDENSGEVKIVGAGTAEITVTAKATRNYAGTSVKCEVTVHKAEQILNSLPELVKVNGGDPFSVTPATNAEAENPTISYQSDNASVIDLDEDGNFQIKGVGTATITVLAGETANYQNTKVTFKIQVLANTASLEEVIAAAENILNGLEDSDIGDGDSQYPQSAVDEFTEAIKEAKQVAEQAADASQEVVDAAAEVLLSAIEEFQNSLIRVDFTQLDTAISQAEGLSGSDYTTESWAKLEEVLIAGKVDRKMHGVTQAQVEEAAEKILNAIAALVDLDITPPTGEISVRENKWTSLLNTITFGLFFKNSVVITITGEDLESGVAEIEYYLSDQALPDTTNWDTIDWVSGREVSVTANWKGIAYARITDNQKNQTVISSDGLIVYTDSQPDTEAISFTKTDTTDVAAKVTLNGNTVAGITNGTYTLNVDTDYTIDTDTGVITFKAAYLNTLVEGNYTLTVSYHPMGLTYVSGTENEIPDTTTIVLTVTRASQDISGVSGMTKTYGDQAFKISPTAKGSPAFTFESSNPDVAAIAEDGTITITGAGETTITIKAAATDDYTSSETSFKLTVEKAANTITNLTSLNKTYGESAFTISPQANETPVFHFVSSNPEVVSIDQTTGEATITGAGSAIITVSAAATANYKAASARFSVNVAQSDGQVITGLTDYQKTYGDGTFTLTPNGKENPVFTYASSHAGVAAVDPNTGEVTIVGAGIAEITVTAAATGNYAGTTARCVVTVHKAEQTLNGLPDLVKVNGGASFTVTPGTNAAAEQPMISYQSSDVAVIDFAEDGNFLIKGVGTATITILAGETANYQAAAATFNIQVLADTASLEEVIAAAESLVNGLAGDDIGAGDSQYPQNAVDELADAIEKAKAVANDTEASQEAVDTAAEELLTAIEEFQKSLIQVDFAQLDSAITQAESLTESDYTAATWEVLKKALAAGKTVRETKGVTQAEADAAAEEVLAAIADLESVYQFITGFDTFTGSGSVTATVEAPYDKFVSLMVGGVQLDQDCYIVSEGSTIITLPETYLKTLENGTYAVTARFTDGAAATTLKVNVSGTKEVTGVTLDQSKAKVTVGKTLKLTATVTPSDATNQNVTWSSSDTSIASVNKNGKVTGIKAGSVIVTVTTEDGGYTATCKVTVAAAGSSNTNTSSGTKSTVSSSGTKNTVPTTTTQGTVKTDDNQNIWLWISLLGTSGVLLLGIYLIRKRRLSVRNRK